MSCSFSLHVHSHYEYLLSFTRFLCVNNVDNTHKMCLNQHKKCVIIVKTMQYV
nr:MAG TPA: hypothetical protein [Caudoviricetes sp.]